MIFKIIGVLGVSLLCFGQQKITDVPASDSSYPAIKRSVEKGYFTLMDGTKFLPDQSVNRKEMAILLDRMDELSKKASLSANDIVELKKGKISEFSLDPSLYGFEKKELKTIKGGDPKYNALELKELLNGKEGPYKDIVLLNSAAAIIGSGHENEFEVALKRARLSLENGHALSKLNGLIQITNK